MGGQKPYEKYVGEKFGKLTILDFIPGDYTKGKKRIRVRANCECDCGIIKTVDWEHLKEGAINSCGCLRDPSVSLGQKFANMTVLEIIPHHYNEQGKRILTQVKCECICGKIKAVNLNSLQCGNTISCGCVGQKKVIDAATKHGYCYNQVYNTWHGINNRCYNDKLKAYKNYGARGISNYWKDDPGAFVEYIEKELGPRPGDEYSLDRINNNGNYEPGNLRWATHKQQANNKTHAYQRKIEGLEGRIKMLEEELCELKKKTGQ